MVVFLFLNATTYVHSTFFLKCILCVDYHIVESSSSFTCIANMGATPSHEDDGDEVEDSDDEDEVIRMQRRYRVSFEVNRFSMS